MSLGGRPCALGKKRELVPAVPMSWDTRMGHYCQQNYSGRVTPRQFRRAEKKRRRQERRKAAK